MGAVAVLRQLWHHWVLVAVGAALAVVAGLMVAYQVTPGIPPTLKSRQYEVGIASAAVLVDSRTSQVVDLEVGPDRPDVSQVSVRARLLANLMATSPLKDQIAAKAGVRPDWLIGHPPAEGGPVANRTPQGPNATISEDDRRASVLTVYVNETLPIITADVRGPDAATAAKVAGASITMLARYVKAATASNRLPDARALVVSRLGAAKSGTLTQGNGPLLGVVLFVFVFGAWCAALVAGSSLVRAWREAASDAATPAGESPGGSGSHPAPQARDASTIAPAAHAPPVPAPPVAVVAPAPPVRAVDAGEPADRAPATRPRSPGRLTRGLLRRLTSADRQADPRDRGADPDADGETRAA
jgi:hypothetical protein